MIAGLRWIGGHASWLLAGAVVLCFAAPGLPDLMRPALPLMVPLVLGLAMARIDLAAAVRAAIRPREALALAGLTLALMPISAAVYLAAARLIGVDADHAAALVYLAAAPPIASAGSLCFILGYDARRAIEVTIAATLLTPLIGPLTVGALLPGEVPLSAAALARNLGLMVLAGAALGVGVQLAAGRSRIAAQARAFDGVAVIALVLMVLPLFAGVPELIAAEPGRAAVSLALALAANLGVGVALRPALRRLTRPDRAGAYALLFANRTIALYVAALPYDPHLALFVALYQIPILLTPLALRGKRAGTPN